MTELQDAVKNGDTGILLFVHGNGAHYVTIDYDEGSPKHFRISNYKNYKDEAMSCFTLQTLFDKGNFPIVLYSIQNGEEK